MLTAVEAEIDIAGNVRLLEPLEVKRPTRAIVTLLPTPAADEERGNSKSMLEFLQNNRLSESSRYTTPMKSTLRSRKIAIRGISQRESLHRRLFIHIPGRRKTAICQQDRSPRRKFGTHNLLHLAVGRNEMLDTALTQPRQDFDRKIFQLVFVSKSIGNCTRSLSCVGEASG